jgi:hypothetical protein
LVDAQDVRAEVERAALDLMKASKPAPGTVTVNLDLAERQLWERALADNPARHGEYNPFTTERIFGSEE